MPIRRHSRADAAAVVLVLAIVAVARCGSGSTTGGKARADRRRLARRGAAAAVLSNEQAGLLAIRGQGRRLLELRRLRHTDLVLSFTIGGWTVRSILMTPSRGRAYRLRRGPAHGHHSDTEARWRAARRPSRAASSRTSRDDQSAEVAPIELAMLNADCTAARPATAYRLLSP